MTKRKGIRLLAALALCFTLCISFTVPAFAYPRTDSQFITEDMESTARQVIGIVSRKLPLFQRITHEPDIGQITNNAKVTDHHAIIPTVQLENQDLAELPESEQKIIRLIAMRLLSATGEKHIYDETSVTLTCEGYDIVKIS